jgi:hypothetical protein
VNLYAPSLGPSNCTRIIVDALDIPRRFAKLAKQFNMETVTASDIQNLCIVG